MKELPIMKKILSVAVLAGGLAINPLPASADDDKSTDPLTYNECPGIVGDKSSLEAMFCTEAQPPRAEGPYYTNFVDSIDGKQHFCTWRPEAGIQCEKYWPFKNPTVNEHLAPESAFADEYQFCIDKSEYYGWQNRITHLEAVIEKKDATIDRLRAKVQELRERLKNKR